MHLTPYLRPTINIFFQYNIINYRKKIAYHILVILFKGVPYISVVYNQYLFMNIIENQQKSHHLYKNIKTRKYKLLCSNKINIT